MGILDLFKSKRRDSEMAKANVAVIYYSSTGTNYKLAQWAEEGAKEAGLK